MPYQECDVQKGSGNKCTYNFRPGEGRRGESEEGAKELGSSSPPHFREVPSVRCPIKDEILKNETAYQKRTQFNFRIKKEK